MLGVLDSVGGERSIEEWNSEDLWRGEYDSMTEGHLFFAEDVFGEQFSLRDDAVFKFDPETGEAKELCSSLESWAELVVTDYEVVTGFPIAHEWQLKHGALPPGQRLVPKHPFALGGEYELGNLFAIEAVEGMRMRGEIARQIRDLPDGSAVSVKIVD